MRGNISLGLYLGTRTHSSKFCSPNWPSEPRPHENTCPLSFRASVWDSPHDTATMICASRATTCSGGRRREPWLITSRHVTRLRTHSTNLVSCGTSRVPAVLGHCIHRCTLSRPPAGRLCACGRTPNRTLASRERIHIFVAQQQSLHRFPPSLAVHRRHFPSTAWRGASLLRLRLCGDRERHLGSYARTEHV